MIRTFMKHPDHCNRWYLLSEFFTDHDIPANCECPLAKAYIKQLSNNYNLDAVMVPSERMLGDYNIHIQFDDEADEAAFIMLSASVGINLERFS